jgi:N-acetyl-alpha-D-muramate 1-phosphate uridylyltransferase
MADSLAAVVLAAGAGTRLRPLTRLRPKAMCPVNNVPLVDLAIARATHVTDSIAVNVHHGRALMEAHLRGQVHLSIEPDHALGTAGGIAQLRPWIDGRAVLVVNADAWFADATVVRRLAEGWDGERIRLLVVEDALGSDFDGRWRYAGAALLPWVDVAALEVTPSGLYEVSWRAAHANGVLDLVPCDVVFRDCGTPADYLDANLLASGGESVIGLGATVDGVVEESVVWPGAEVLRHEHLRRAIRADDRVTILVR